MIKKLLTSLCVIMMLCLLISPVHAKEDIQLYSEYAYLVDLETKLVYIDKNSHEKIYPASMTKILTVSLALEKIKDINEKVTVTYDDLKGLYEQGATVAGFYAGEQVTYEDLLYGALLPSGADACNALARLTYGSIDKMVEAMNQKMASLNLKDSHFMNVTGLHDDQHFTTVYDMSVILEDALKNPEFVKVFEARTHQDSKKSKTWLSVLERAARHDINTENIRGGKSGFTDEAQLTLASTMTIDGHPFILVSAYAKGQYNYNQVKDAVAVYDYMTSQYHSVQIYKKNDILSEYWVIKALEFKYQWKMPTDLTLIVDKEWDVEKIEKKIETVDYLSAPIKKGESIGKVTIRYQNQDLYSFDMVMTEEIASPARAKFLFYGTIIGLPTIVLLLIIRFIYRKVTKRK